MQDRTPEKIKDLATAKEPEKTKKERKPKEQTKAVEEKSAKFPTEGKISKYGFIYLDSHVRAAWGLSKSAERKITIEVKDGNLIISKKV